MRALICGVGGQDGSYMAMLLLDKGYEVIGASRDAMTASFSNLQKLGIKDRVTTVSMDLTDFRSVFYTVSKFCPDEIYNLAGQSSVGLSFEQPVETVESIIVGTLNILEAIRFSGRPIRLYNAGSSECFGDAGDKPATEKTPFSPRSPYAVSKASAHYLVQSYRESYNLYACTGILFNHESPLRPERFVTQKIVRTAARIAAGSDEKLVMGNIDIQRDWGWAPEYVEAMWQMLQQPQPEDFVIATGETHSLQDFVAAAFTAVNLDWHKHVDIDPALMRPSDLNISRADPSLAQAKLGWQAQTRMAGVVKNMVEAAHE